MLPIPFRRLCHFVFLSVHYLCAAVIIYPKTEGAVESDTYQVTVNGKPVMVYPTPVGHFATFACSEKVMIKVSSTGEVREAIIRPQAIGIKPTVGAQSVEFELSSPKYLSVELNGSTDKPLFIFADEPESIKVDPQDPHVIYYGGAKIYQVGTLSLVSDQTLYLEAGTILQASLKISGKKNVRILGRGIIDNQTNGGRSIRAEKSSGLTIDGPLFLNVDSWAVVAAESEKIRYHAIKILNWDQGPRATPDGMDFIGCSNVSVDTIFIRSYDDAISIKNKKFAWSGNTEQIEIQNAVLWNGPAGNVICVGWELNNEYVRNLKFKNIDIIHKQAKPSPNSRAAISIHQVDGAKVSSVLFENIRIEDCQERFFNFRIVSSGNASYKSDRRGVISDVILRNVRVTGGASLPSIIEGFDAEHLVEKLTFENLIILGQPVASLEEGQFTTSFAKDIRFIKTSP
jgi:hypothetical protein